MSKLAPCLVLMVVIWGLIALLALQQVESKPQMSAMSQGPEAVMGMMGTAGKDNNPWGQFLDVFKPKPKDGKKDGKDSDKKKKKGKKDKKKKKGSSSEEDNSSDKEKDSDSDE